MCCRDMIGRGVCGKRDNWGGVTTEGCQFPHVEGGVHYVVSELKETADIVLGEWGFLFLFLFLFLFSLFMLFFGWWRKMKVKSVNYNY